ncbi:MAG TPA: hypothetical protein VFA04_16895, partial [Bryobacteraceae bacterium]|nr:hypothetical protein [Bryobacteraceae bacterium]
MDIPLSGNSTAGRLFDISSSDVTLENLWIDGSGAATGIPSGDRYAFFAAGSAAQHIANVHVLNSRVTNLTESDGRRPATHTASFGAYFQWVDDSSLINNVIENVSADAIHFVSTQR